MPLCFLRWSNLPLSTTSPSAAGLGMARRCWKPKRWRSALWPRREGDGEETLHERTVPGPGVGNMQHQSYSGGWMLPTGVPSSGLNWSGSWGRRGLEDCLLCLAGGKHPGMTAHFPLCPSAWPFTGGNMNVCMQWSCTAGGLLPSTHKCPAPCC